MTFPIVCPNRHHAVLSLAVIALLAVALQCGFAALTRAGDALPHFVGHLISGFRDFSLSPLDPAYPRCF